MMGWQFMGAGGWLWMLASILFLVGVGVLTVGRLATSAAADASMRRPKPCGRASPEAR
jgi:hypothetical protein